MHEHSVPSCVDAARLHGDDSVNRQADYEAFNPPLVYRSEMQPAESGRTPGSLRKNQPFPGGRERHCALGSAANGPRLSAGGWLAVSVAVCGPAARAAAVFVSGPAWSWFGPS
jgi:hypothetical protein